MLDKIWHKTKRIVQHNNNPNGCFLTVYSRHRGVVNDIVDTYLDRSKDFSNITNDLKQGRHAIYISKDLSHATKKLIRLKRLGKLADVDGAACHLFANIKPAILERLIERNKDYRRFLREAEDLSLLLQPSTAQA